MYLKENWQDACLRVLAGSVSQQPVCGMQNTSLETLYFLSVIWFENWDTNVQHAYSYYYYILEKSISWKTFCFVCRTFQCTLKMFKYSFFLWKNELYISIEPWSVSYIALNIDWNVSNGLIMTYKHCLWEYLGVWHFWTTNNDVCQTDPHISLLYLRTGGSAEVQYLC